MCRLTLLIWEPSIAFAWIRIHGADGGSHHARQPSFVWRPVSVARTTGVAIATNAKVLLQVFWWSIRSCYASEGTANVQRSRSVVSYSRFFPQGNGSRRAKLARIHGSADDVRDGFIHLSAAHQVAGTAAKYFRDQPELLLVAFDAAGLGPALKWEPSRGGDVFPHLYSPLPTARALWTKPLPLGVMTNACFQHDDGMPALPERPTMLNSLFSTCPANAFRACRRRMRTS